MARVFEPIVWRSWWKPIMKFFFRRDRKQLCARRLVLTAKEMHLAWLSASEITPRWLVWFYTRYKNSMVHWVDQVVIPFVGSVAGQLRLSRCLLTFAQHLVRDRPSKTLLLSLMARGSCMIPLGNTWKPFRPGFRFLKRQWNRIQTEVGRPTVLLFSISIFNIFAMQRQRRNE